MIAEPRPDIEAILKQTDLLEDAVRHAVRDALRHHKALGNPIAEWRDGRVVWIPADEIQIEDEAGSA